MTRDDEQASNAEARRASADAVRKHRLAEALRENLKRRKAQARGRRANDRDFSIGEPER